MAGYVKLEFMPGLEIEISLDEISKGVRVDKNKEVQWLGPEEI